MASLERLRTCLGLVLFVGVGALCLACIVGRFPWLLCVGVYFCMGSSFFRACSGVLCGVEVCPGGLTRGKTEQGSMPSSRKI